MPQDAAVDLWSMNEDEKRLRSARSLHRLEVAAAHGAAVIAAQDVAKSAAQAAEEAEAKAAAAEALVRSSQEKDGAVPNKLAQQRAQALRAEAEELATAAEHAAVAQAEATAAAGVAARLRAQNEVRVGFRSNGCTLRPICSSLMRCGFAGTPTHRSYRTAAACNAHWPVT